MNKRDIGLEKESLVSELMEWRKRLEWVSPALGQLFQNQAAYISSRKPSDFDAGGMRQMMGKVNGLIAAASVLMDEWHEHNGDPTGTGTV